MHGPEDMQDTSVPIGLDDVDGRLDIFGQNPRLSGLYTQLCFCFDLPDTTSQAQSGVTEYLQKGLDELCHQLPWTSGHVTRDVGGVYRIERHGKPISLMVQDRRDELPSMSAYHEAGFPFSRLDEATVAARKTLPGDSHEPAPVLLVKATFIKDGLLLNFDAQHDCMDLAGQCQVIRLLSKACRDEPLTQEEIRTGNLPRHDIIPEKEEFPAPEPSQPTPQSQTPATGPTNPTPASTQDAVWAYFLFPAPSLAALKSLATRTQTTPFVSTDDALSAFVWQGMTRARAPDFDADPSLVDSTFDRQVDARRALGIPAGYPGMVVHKVAVRKPWRAVRDADLGELASALRAAIGTEAGIARAVCESAEGLREKLSQGGDEGVQGGGARKAGISAADVRMSSWAKEGCCEFDFGGDLGRPAAVRRPAFPGWEGLAYFMPKATDGEIAVALCLRAEAMERLKVDEEFVKYGRYVG